MTEEEKNEQTTFKLTEAKGKQGNLSLFTKAKFQIPDTDLFCTRISPDDKFIAAGCSDGSISIYNLEVLDDERAKHAPLQSLGVQAQALPTTSVRWRPHITGSKTKHILVSANADGSLTYWHVASGKMMHRIVEENNQILAIDYNVDGSLLATTGKDYKIRIYDENIKSVATIFHEGSWQGQGHSNRVFSLKFLNDEPNILLSAGWDGTLHIWDTRAEKHVGCIFGVTCSGDSIDYKNGQILAGSYRNKDQLQLWDFKQQKLIQNINWYDGYNSETAYVYCAQFSKASNNYIAAGCSGLNEIKVFDVKNNYKPCCFLGNIQKGCFSLDFCNYSNKLTFGGGDSEVHYCEIK